MKIAVKKAAPDVFALTFDDVEVALDSAGLKSLLLEVTRILAPGTDLATTEEERVRDLARRLKNANSVGVQKLLMSVDQEDILVLLTAANEDKALRRKVYGNMSERSRKILAEDLAFTFRDGLPAGRLKTAIQNLSDRIRDLEGDGTITYDNVVSR